MARKRAFRPGDVVRIEGRRTVLIRRHKDIPGGWWCEPKVHDFNSWNEFDMTLVSPAPKGWTY